MNQATNLHLHRQANKIQYFLRLFWQRDLRRYGKFQVQAKGFSVVCNMWRQEKAWSAGYLILLREIQVFHGCRSCPNVVIEVTANEKQTPPPLVAIYYPDLSLRSHSQIYKYRVLGHSIAL